MAIISAPLLPPPGGRAEKTKTGRRALFVAALAAAGALAAVATIVSGVRAPAMAMLMNAPGAVAEPVYYVPLKAVPTAAPKTQLGITQQPVVYYYVPESAAASLKQASIYQSLANDTASNATAAPAFVCTKDNLKKVSAEVQAKWTACQTSVTDYKEPNAAAKRRLLGWVWEGPGQPSMLANDTAAAGNATAAAPAGPLLADCEKKALGGNTNNVCVSIAGCKDSVCANYYNEPEIEALCGMCTMGVGASGVFGCFARDATVRVPIMRAHALHLWEV